MTKYPPGQSPEGYGSQQQPPYGQGQSSYGYGNDQGYQQAQGHQQSYGYADNRGQAESYYGANDQAYQSYAPPTGPPGQQYGQQAPHYPPPQTYGETSYNQAYGSPAPQYSQGQYGGPPPPHQSNPGYGEGYHQQHYVQQPSGEVDAFKSQFDQAHVAPGQYGQYPPPGAEGDRGLMGALAGGAAGAFGGHKMGHGVLGGLGGAVAGSMLEDAYKKHDKKGKKDKKEKKHKSHSRRGSSSSSSSSSSSDSDSRRKKHGKAGTMAGNFHASSRSVRLEPHCVLVAECADMNGHHRSSSLDLNQCLTNTNGRLKWARGGMFGASARNVHLTEGGAVLECELGDGRGGWAHNRIALNERITNTDGRLEFLA